jgi:phosphoenolpyruvate carboxylase
MLEALAAQRRLVLKAYRRDVLELRTVLTQSSARAGIDERVIGRIADYKQRLPGEAGRAPDRRSDMPYGELLNLVAVRLADSADNGPSAYADSEEFAADLRLIDASLQAHRGEHAGRFALNRVLRRLQCFGFHLAALDLRQDAAVHDAALAELLQQPAFAELAPEARTPILHALMRGRSRDAGRRRRAGRCWTCSAPCAAVVSALASRPSGPTSSA